MNKELNTNKDTFIDEYLKLPGTKELSQESLNLLKGLRRDSVSEPVISVSITSAGIIAGANDTYEAIEEYIQERELKATVIPVGSLGLVSAEPVVDIQLPGKARLTFSNVFPEKTNELLDAVFNNIVPEEYVLGQHKSDFLEPWENINQIDDHPFFADQERVILKNCGMIDPSSVEEYIAHNGYKNFLNVINNFTPEEVCDTIEKSGLRGRGGEGYPTALKWKNALLTPAEQRYLVCNAGESDPGAYMERMIIESDPHSVIESVAIAAYAIGAQKAYVYLPCEYELACERLTTAISQAKRFGILGNDVFRSGFNINIDIHKGAGAYVCGEETALISSLEGKRGMPRPKPPYPTKYGFNGKPTVVNNVETLLNLPAIIRNGYKWYKETGTKDTSGTKVFSTSGKIERAGMIEIQMGTPVREIVYKVCGGIPDNKELKGVLIGGPAGGVITYDNLDTGIDYESVKNIGGALGSGGLIIMDEDTCIVNTVKYYMDFLRHESCGKCIPCREGIRRMYEILDNITTRPEENEHSHKTLERFKGAMHLEKLATVIKDTSLCGLGQRAANPVLSSLRFFREEYDEHIFERKCQAGVCQELRTFYIDVDKCTGCTICAKKCPTDAIIGTPKNAHFIVQEKCIGCGICYESCKFGAIISK
jgi:NADH:ubiquinone oxidoreductase subunit F (NADH-binding)